MAVDWHKLKKKQHGRCDWTALRIFRFISQRWWYETTTYPGIFFAPFFFFDSSRHSSSIGGMCACRILFSTFCLLLTGSPPPVASLMRKLCAPALFNERGTNEISYKTTHQRQQQQQKLPTDWQGNRLTNASVKHCTSNEYLNEEMRLCAECVCGS